METKTVKQEIKDLRQRAATLEFLERLKGLGTRKDFVFKISNSTIGTIISVETNNSPVKLPIDDCLDEFKLLVIAFFEDRLNPKKPEPELLLESEVELVEEFNLPVISNL